MINISFDKRLELLFGLQYCTFKDNNIKQDIFQENNKQYCEDFYNLYKENASEELIEYIKNGGLDLYNRTVDISDSLDKNYNIIENEKIKKISSNNKNFDKDKLNRLLNEFIIKSNYEKFYEDHKSYYDEVVNVFKKSLNYLVDYDDKMLTDFYGYKLNDFQIIVFNFTRGSFGMDFDNKITYIANTYPLENENELVRVPNRIIATLFHEFSHPYCNPLGYKYFNDDSIKNIEEESIQNGLEDCYRGITVINEYMVRAVQMYLSKKYIPNEYYNIENDIKRHQSKGFVHIDELLELLSKKEEYDNFEDFYKEQIVSFFSELNNSKKL